MGISDKTRKILWGRSGNRCAICRHELVMDAISFNDDESIIGEECHIVARETNGPRGQSPLAQNERDAYGNLILLCRIHHKLIDDQPNTYDAEHLNIIKANHENWVRESLNFGQEIKGGQSFPARQINLNEENLDDNLSSELGKDYTKLRDFLAEENWQAADEETGTLMSGVFRQDVKNFPPTDLQTIDQPWLKYSNGRFGFSVQRRVLNDTFCGSKATPQTCLSDYELPESMEARNDRLKVRWERFGENLGWRKQGQWIMAVDYTHALTKQPQGYLPLLGAPPNFFAIRTNKGMTHQWWALLLHLQPWTE